MPDLSPTSEISVFLLAENRLLRDALVSILSKRSDFKVVGSCSFTQTALSELAATSPQVVLLDSPNLAFHGPRLVLAVRNRLPAARVVMIGMDREEATFLRAVREAVMGYVLQDASPSELVNVVRAVGSGDAVYPPTFSAAVLTFASQQLASMPDLINLTRAGLSRREQQLVELVQLGLTNKEIGLRLNLAERTVKNHLHRIFRKVNVRDRMTMVERIQSDNNIAV